MKMKILIVNPYRFEKPLKDKEKLFRRTQLWDEEDLRDYGAYPLEAPYLGGILRKNGFEPVFIDAQQMRLRAVDLDFSGYGAVIAGTAPFGKWRCAQFSYAHAVEVLKAARKAGCEKTIIYGPHATVAPGTFVDSVDSIIRGEPEGSIIKALKEDAKVIELNEAILPECLDEWSPPAFDLIDFDSGFYDAKYIFEGKITGRLGTISGSRGCPYPCSFCFKVMIPEKMRFHTPERFFEMAKELAQNYGCRAFNFSDLTFTLNKKWVMEVCKRLATLGIPYMCASRCDRIDEDIASALRDSGCYKIELGVESASDNILASIKKGHTWEESIKVIDLLRKKGIPMVRAFQIFFSPGETEETVSETYRKLKDAGLEITPAICTPYPSTGIWERGVSEGKFPANLTRWDDYIEYISRNAGTVGTPFKRADLESVLERESIGFKQMLNKARNEYRKNGLRGVIKKGLKKIK